MKLSTAMKRALLEMDNYVKNGWRLEAGGWIPDIRLNVRQSTIDALARRGLTESIQYADVLTASRLTDAGKQTVELLRKKNDK